MHVQRFRLGVSLLRVGWNTSGLVAGYAVLVAAVLVGLNDPPLPPPDDPGASRLGPQRPAAVLARASAAAPAQLGQDAWLPTAYAVDPVVAATAVRRSAGNGRGHLSHPTKSPGGKARSRANARSRGNARSARTGKSLGADKPAGAAAKRASVDKGRAVLHGHGRGARSNSLKAVPPRG